MEQDRRPTAHWAPFITFEGVEGCGKTTQAERLAERLAASGIPVVLTREPGGTPIGERIRALVLDAKSEGMEPLAEALLYEAARAQFVVEIVQPALLAGTVVICDRYIDSTLAYQGYGRGLPLDTLACLNVVATAGIVPDLTILVDVPVAVGLARRAGGGDWNRFDAAGQAFHGRVYDGYHALATHDAGRRWRIIDGAADIETVAAAVWDVAWPVIAGNAA